MEKKNQNWKPLLNAADAAKLFEKLPVDAQDKIIELIKSILAKM